MRDSRIESPKLAQETGRLVCHGWRSKISGFELYRKEAERISGQGSPGRMGFPVRFFWSGVL